jgi:hypothetical protein
MMILSISALGNNLKETWALANCSNADDVPLVPNLSGTKLYISSSGWGRLWRWFFDYYSIFYGTSLEQCKLHHAIDLTRHSFLHHLKAVQEDAFRYRAYLTRLSQKEPADENKMHRYRKSIKAWNTSIYPTYKAIKNLENSLLVETHIKQHILPLHIEPEAIKDIRRCQKIIALEGILEEPLPIEILYLASLDEELTFNQEKVLKRFVKKVNRSSTEITMRSFHRTMSDLIALFKRAQPDTKPDLANLELMLSRYGWDLYIQPDKVHMDWRDTCAPGQTYYCNGREIILGEELPSVEHEEDYNRVFTVKNDDSLIVSIGINEAIHPLKRRVAKDSEWGIHSAAYIDVCPKFALIEKLKDPINSWSWKSPSIICAENEFFDKADQHVAKPLALLARWFIQENRIPTNFNKNHLMFNQAGQLKCLKIALEGDFNFNVLEEFFWECTNGNAQIFMQIMEFSTLDQHPCAKFYKQMVIDALNNVIQDAGDVAATENVDDYRVVDKGKELYTQVKKLESACMQHLTRLYKTESIDDLNYKVRTALLHYYEMSAAGGFLPPYLKELIINDIVLMEKLVKKPALRVVKKH